MFISNSNKLWWFQTRREELFQSGGRGRYLPFCIVGGGGVAMVWWCCFKINTQHFNICTVFFSYYAIEAALVIEIKNITMFVRLERKKRIF